MLLFVLLVILGVGVFVPLNPTARIVLLVVFVVLMVLVLVAGLGGVDMPKLGVTKW